MQIFEHFLQLHLWLFTTFAQINTSNVQQIICVDTLLGNGTSPSILDRKIKLIEAFQSRLMATSIGFYSLIGIIYLIIYNIVSFFWLYFYSPFQYGDNEIRIVIVIDCLMRCWDYRICNVTYRLDKIERILFELDYEVMDVTNQIFVNFP